MEAELRRLNYPSNVPPAVLSAANTWYMAALCCLLGAIPISYPLHLLPGLEVNQGQGQNTEIDGEYGVIHQAKR